MTYKERLDRHLEYDWFKYVLILILSVVLWWFLYDTVTKPKDFETLHIFALTSSIENEREQYEKSFFSAMDAKNDHTILDFSFETNSPTGNRIGEVILARAMVADIFIVSEAYVKNYAHYGFLPLEDGLLTSYGLGGLNYYESEEGIKYALDLSDFSKIHDIFPDFEYTITQNGEEITYSKIYLAFLQSSNNIGAYSKSKNSVATNDQAFVAAAEFVKLYA